MRAASHGAGGAVSASHGAGGAVPASPGAGDAAEADAHQEQAELDADLRNEITISEGVVADNTEPDITDDSQNS